MPLLWRPKVQTSFATLDPATPAAYTLIVVSTQLIRAGISFRFQMWDGLNYTYAQAITDGVLAEWDLILSQDLQPGTAVVVSMTTTGTSMWGFTGTQTYASGGASVPAAVFTQFASLLVFARQPTDNPEVWTPPAQGHPMFAIGFNFPTGVGDRTEPCLEQVLADFPAAAAETAPNFPDQYASAALTAGIRRKQFQYEVVYPVAQPYTLDDGTTDCFIVDGIKVLEEPLYPLGSWTNLREVIAQPWTTIAANVISVNNWVALNDPRYTTDDVPYMSPNSGPITLTAMSGQLVPVYFRPTYKDIDSPDYIPGPFTAQPPAELAVLVVSPLAPNQSVYFTNAEYNYSEGGFGPRRDTTGEAPFVYADPAFTWTTGVAGVPAGTVVLFSNIGGTGDMTVVNVHDTTTSVGSITSCAINILPLSNQAVTSLIALGVWANSGNIYSSTPIDLGAFVCAAISDQYAGDVPPLAPCITIHRDRFVGRVIFGRGITFDSTGKPATVWAPLINSSPFLQIAWDETLTSADFPVFTGMTCFSW